MILLRSVDTRLRQPTGRTSRPSGVIRGVFRVTVFYPLRAKGRLEVRPKNRVTGGTNVFQKIATRNTIGYHFREKLKQVHLGWDKYLSARMEMNPSSIFVDSLLQVRLINHRVRTSFILK